MSKRLSHIPSCIGIALGLLLPAPALTNGSGVFPDSASSPYFVGIEYGREQGIVEGYPDGTFRPMQTINRAEFTKIIVEAYASEDLINRCLAEYGRSFSYPDAPQSAWYGKYLCVGHRMMDIRGYPDGKFRPEQPVNFAEAAKILTNAAALEWNPDDANFLETTVWYRSYTLALARLAAIPPSVASYAHFVTRGDMMEMIYRLQTGLSSLPESETWVDSRHTDIGISFRYPTHTFVRTQGTAWWPFGQGGKQFPGIQLVHAIPTEYCGESGLPEHCTPLTRDITIGFFVIPQSWETVKAQADEWQKQDIFESEGRKGFFFTMGVEGKYTHYVFLPLTDTTTLMVTRDSIDENTLLSYKDAPHFLPAADQEALFLQVMHTLHFFSLSSEQCGAKLTLTLPFYSEDDLQNAFYDHPVRILRCVDRTPTVADTALRLLFVGPTEEEQLQGARGSNDLQRLGTLYIGVTINDGIAIVNFTQEALQILNSTAARQFMAKEPIRSTLLQFSSVNDVQYAIDGVVYEEWDA